MYSQYLRLTTLIKPVHQQFNVIMDYERAEHKSYEVHKFIPK